MFDALRTRLRLRLGKLRLPAGPLATCQVSPNNALLRLLDRA